ncbi:MAG TPA: hydroxymethylbilane synthase [Candidatus Binataceae bacterium]|jgi:hydroxymethylbilane synthase|nr:hydroxymethylbilane synthase [Candidatus Binataceae bacterium]
MATLRIGSRPSALALAQAALVRSELAALMPSVEIEIVPIRTSGDKLGSAALAQVGGKGLFVKELEQALAERRIDLAVHSMKDLPAVAAPGMEIAAVPERADARDALLMRAAGGGAHQQPAPGIPAADAMPAAQALAPLARGARLGTSSPRRRFEALRIRADLDVGALRGNVDTRLGRLVAGDFDAIILAMAGLARLARARPAGVTLFPLDERDFVPAGGQGALAVEARAGEPLGGSAELAAALARLDDARARREVSAERGFLAALGASCVSPVGVRARLDNGVLNVRALVFSVDGARHLADELSEARAADASPARAAEAGARLARRMLERGGRELLGDG